MTSLSTRFLGQPRLTKPTFNRILSSGQVTFRISRGPCSACRYNPLRRSRPPACYIRAVRILIIDDDAELCALLEEFLRREGYQSACENDGRRGLEAALHGGFSLIVLDVMLPGMDGFEILRRLRQHSKVPVLMLTARGEDTDRIVGLELGADDSLPNPFNSRELVARIRAILRRMEPRDAPAARVEVNGIAIDPGSRSVWRRGEPVEVTTFEFDILETLMRTAGRAVSRDALMEQ